MTLLSLGACTVPFSGMTAWKSLHEAGVLPNSTSRGKTVLVVDATSATGCLAVQLARAWGASVVAVVNHRKLGPLATMLGATNVIVVDNDEYSEVCQKNKHTFQEGLHAFFNSLR